jgi:hypothetical protein
MMYIDRGYYERKRGAQFNGMIFMQSAFGLRPLTLANSIEQSLQRTAVI